MKNKIYELRLKGKSINEIVDELDCANCHIEIHEKERLKNIPEQV